MDGDFNDKAAPEKEQIVLVEILLPDQILTRTQRDWRGEPMSRQAYGHPVAQRNEFLAHLQSRNMPYKIVTMERNHLAVTVPKDRYDEILDILKNYESPLGVPFGGWSAHPVPKPN